ncbi:MAG: rRNA pseudouridine synthase [Pseudomonadota bacterium]|nr:rRNA pseudouridine synthase [Pseudomonadota bacterium]
MQIAAIGSSFDTMRAMTTPKPAVQTIEISARHSDQRLDNFLIGQLKGLPKSLVYKLLRSGQVRVNKGRKKADYRLQAGDQVRIPPVNIQEKTDNESAPKYLLEQVRQCILFEDEFILALNKPVGLAVHGGSNIRFGAIEVLRQLRPDDDMLELAHRLDRDTSGVLLFAKTRPTLMRLHELFRNEHQMQKIYQAILVDRWQGGERLIDVPLRKNSMQGGESMVVVDHKEGKESRSLFIPQAYYETATLMEIHLQTGRTHQIRVHAAHVGHPVAGDSKYGDEGFNRYLKEQGLKRMFLHAWQLRFKLDKNYTITAPVDADWQRAMDLLEST